MNNRWTMDRKIALGGVIVAALGGVAVPLALNSDGATHGRGGRSSTSDSTPTATTSRPRVTSQPRPVFLSSLTPSAGDVPQRGDSQVKGADFPHSIFYENIQSDVSASSSCDSADGADCRATSYDLGGKYRSFTAHFGIAQGANNAVTARGDWEISVDDQVVKQGTTTGNSAPEKIRVSFGSGRVLALRVVVHEAIGDTTNVVWGDARVR
jgi:hypothetical protein